MQRRDMLLAFCVGLPTLALALYLIISTLPYMSIIGKAVTAFLVIILGCGAVLVITETIYRVGSRRAKLRHEKLHSRVIAVEGVVVLEQTDGTYAHLSAEQEAAKVKLLPAPLEKEAKLDPAEDPVNIATVKEMLDHGCTLRTIAQSTGLTYYKVQKMCEALRDN